MHGIDLIQSWLDSVATSHSGAKSTEVLYRYHFDCFLKFINATVEDIQKDYDMLPDRQFRHKYAQVIRAWNSHLMRQDYTSGSISAFVIAVKSFFKHNDFPLSFIPTVRRTVTYHNRDIDKAEIIQILGMSMPREKAFYAIMAQSGLRPSTLCKLKLKHLESNFSQSKNPVMITVPEDLTKGKYHEYFTFIAEDAVRFLKDYLNTRQNLTKESLLFMNEGDKKPMIYNTASSMFRKTVRLLRDKGAMNYEQKKEHRPAEIRLYSLRKWFRKMANQAGFENVEFWMGHTGPGVDASYRPKDPEFYRAIYIEKAAPSLRLESATPNETETVLKELRKERESDTKRISELERTLQVMTNLVSSLSRTKEQVEIDGKLVDVGIQPSDVQNFVDVQNLKEEVAKIMVKLAEYEKKKD